VDRKREPGLPRALTAGLAGLAVLGLLALVALGSRGGHPGAHFQAHQRQVPAQVGNDLLTAMVIVYGVGVLVLIAVFLTFRHKWQDPQSRWLRDLVVTLLVCGFVTLVGYKVLRHGGLARLLHLNQHASTPVGGHARTSQTLPQLPGPKQAAHLDWRFAALLGGLALLAAAFFLVRGRRDRRTPAAEPDVEEELDTAVGESIDDLRRESDPRKAVIAAYARMEGVLRRHGRARRAAEAPYEYLERVLGDLRVRPAAVKELTELFERAKFSVHQIDGGMKTRAIDALVAVREDLGRA
jgi:multisubunit Na+/H+ antiporter MnhB subunit